LFVKVLVRFLFCVRLTSAQRQRSGKCADRNEISPSCSVSHVKRNFLSLNISLTPSKDNPALLSSSVRFMAVTTTNELQRHKFYWFCVAPGIKCFQSLESFLMALCA
jgi:hypothetical protein